MDNLREFIQEEIENIIFTKVSFDESLIESKILDSITIVDLIVCIEEKTGVYVPATDVNATNFDTIDKIISYLQKKI